MNLIKQKKKLKTYAHTTTIKHTQPQLNIKIAVLVISFKPLR